MALLTRVQGVLPISAFGLKSQDAWTLGLRECIMVLIISAAWELLVKNNSEIYTDLGFEPRSYALSNLTLAS